MCFGMFGDQPTPSAQVIARTPDPPQPDNDAIRQRSLREQARLQALGNTTVAANSDLADDQRGQRRVLLGV